jgi:hypothetical protein
LRVANCLDGRPLYLHSVRVEENDTSHTS